MRNKISLSLLGLLCLSTVPAHAEDPAVVTRGGAPRLGASRASAPGKATAGPVTLTFDASTRKFSRHSTFVHSGAQVTLRVIHINSFRNSYTGKLEKLDFHPAPKSIPSTLQPILSNNVANFAAVRPIANDPTIPKVGPIPESLKKAYLDYLEAVQKFTQYLNSDEATLLLKQPELDSRLRGAMLGGQTNVTIRWQSAGDVVQFFKDTHYDYVKEIPDLPTDLKKAPDSLLKFLQAHAQPDSEEALGTDGTEGTSLLEDLNGLALLSRGIPAVADSAGKDLETQYASVVAAQSKFVDLAHLAQLPGTIRDAALMRRNPPIDLKVGDQVPADIADTANALEQQLESVAGKVDTLHTTRQGQLSEVRTSLVAAQSDYQAAIDYVSSPPFLEYTVQADQADEIQATISIKGVSPPAATSNSAAGGGKNDSPAPTSHFDDQTVTYVSSVPVAYRWVLDISAGPVVTNLINTNYDLVPQAGGSGQVIRRGTSDGVDFSTGVLAHYYLTTPYHFSIGPAIGVTASSDPRYLVGASLIIGDRDRLILTAGAAFGNVNRLSSDSVGQAPGTANSVSTHKVMRAGLFFALTYKFNLLH